MVGSTTLILWKYSDPHHLCFEAVWKLARLPMAKQYEISVWMVSTRWLWHSVFEIERCQCPHNLQCHVCILTMDSSSWLWIVTDSMWWGVYAHVAWIVSASLSKHFIDLLLLRYTPLLTIFTHLPTLSTSALVSYSYRIKLCC